MCLCGSLYICLLRHFRRGGFLSRSAKICVNPCDKPTLRDMLLRIFLTQMSTDFYARKFVQYLSCSHLRKSVLSVRHHVILKLAALDRENPSNPSHPCSHLSAIHFNLNTIQLKPDNRQLLKIVFASLLKHF
jgi:hypothetical protein